MIFGVSRPAWARIGFGLLGAWTVAIGGVVVVAASLTMALIWDPALVFGLTGGAATVVLGALVLTQLGTHVRCDAAGLHLPTVGQSHVVPWSRVVGYHKIGVQRGIKRMDDQSAKGATFVVLDYRPPGRDAGRPERIYFWVAGTGPASAKSTREFVTPLDEFAPDKRRRRRAAIERPRP
jgi:hypothetical protein